ncbi:MAG: TldD/PmbA family protein [Candidatus Dadabacteria bacterium]|nr:TldD/PmbA family protein [Candidatus Dadabacteria bacterium]NIS07698.1 TldD/PmbA family protein [Candidatus Dadabacteria bacterium]NIV42277.1 TldD/PmbA family protein [Candidatus Dadabacteria bacterium]NIX14784.1 TldD/PmbA family protein [Candidatus Dadabacteria bacterium]NIY21325.1 TldD/PmbA family protein [Candidatus Dadabacteria bacterium]
MKKLILTVLILIISGSFVIAKQSRTDTAVLKAMELELERSMNKLKLENYDKPYFMSYLVKENTVNQLMAKFGSLIVSDSSKTRELFVDVRVGDYEFDNSVNGQSGSSQSYKRSNFLPIENDIEAIRAVIWQITDDTYKKSLTQYFTKKAKKVQEIDEENLPSFSKEKPSTFIGREKQLVFNKKEWETWLKEISSVVKEYKELSDSTITFTAQKETVFFISSEKSKYITDDILYSINIDLSAISEDGNVINNFASFHYKDLGDIPDTDKLKREFKKVIDEAYEIKNAETINPINVPAILEPEAAGILFHEAVGHRLEGERQIDDTQGQTFTERVGTQIIPTFLSIEDNPTLYDYKSESLLGYFVYDDQGIRGQKVSLIQNGILKNFLLSRTPIKGFLNSNGHGRASNSRSPMARMSNLIIRSQKEVDKEELKKLLIAEVKKQNKEFGLIIKKMTGGETNTSTYDFQAFKATPILLHKVYPDSGEETPVRGVEIVGTPLISINKIIATGKDYKAFNGFCGAESGYVPVSTIAPSILISEIELQKTTSEKEKKTILPPPF